MIGRNLKPVYVGKSAKRRRSRNKKVAQKARVGQRRWRHPDKKAVEGLRLFRWRQKINVITLAHRFSFGRRQNFLVPDDERRACPVGYQSAPQKRTVGRHRITDDLARQLARQIQLDPARDRISAREGNIESARSQCHRPALHQKREQHHDKGNIEITMRTRQSDQHRNRSEEDSYRTAQADPGYENSFVEMKFERREAQEHCSGTRDQHQRQCDGDRAKQGLQQPMRPRQQAEQHEHHDLREPGYGIEEHDDRVMRARLVVADYETGKIDGKKTRRVYRVGESKDDQSAHRHEWCVQALRQSEPIEDERYDLTAGETDDAAENRVPQKSHQRMRPALLPHQQYLDQEEREKYRKGIVGS